jgi:hypothetical protein
MICTSFYSLVLKLLRIFNALLLYTFGKVSMMCVVKTSVSVFARNSAHVG